MSILDWFGFGKDKTSRKRKKRKRLPPPRLAKTKTDEYITKMPEAYKLLAQSSNQGFLPVLRNIRALAEQPNWDGRRCEEALWYVQFGGYDGSPFAGKDTNAVALVFLAAAYETQMWQRPKVITVKEIDRLVAYLGHNWPAKKPEKVRQPAAITKTVDRAYKQSAAFKIENTRIVPPVELEDVPIRKPWELNDEYSRYGWVRHTLMTFRVFVWTALLISITSVGAAIGIGEFDILGILQAVWAFIQEYWMEMLIIALLAALLAWLLRKFFKGRMKSKDGKPSDKPDKDGVKDNQKVESEEEPQEPEESGPNKSEESQPSDLDADDVVKLDEQDEPQEEQKVAHAQPTDEEPESDAKPEKVEVVEVVEEEPTEDEPEAAAPEPEPEPESETAVVQEEEDEEVLKEEEQAEEEVPQQEIDKELREKLRELLKELELEEEGKNQAGAIEDAIERAEEVLDEDDGESNSGSIRTSTYSHGGVHASIESLDARVGNVEPKLSGEIERRLNAILTVMDLCGEEASRRLDGEKLVKEMQVKRGNLARIRRNELQSGTKLLMVDVSGSCSGVAQYALAAAASILRRDPRCVLIVHSNGIPENVYGALEGMLPSPSRCNNGYDVQGWWTEVLRSLNAVAALSGAVNWGDWDAGFIMQQLCESDVSVVWFDHYNNGGVAPACPDLRSGAEDWSKQPVVWYQGIRDAETTALALRLAEKRIRDKR
ncbi:MAG: hypothetical protein CMF62_08795 [Magnetococcales bacterium]|nr:hypothetical protein [Magnetococcales bacterium]